MAVVNVDDIAHVRYQAPDLDRMEDFLTDFGLACSLRTPDRLYMRAAGDAPHVHITQLGHDARPLGFGLRAQHAQDLNTLAAYLGVAVEANSEPGGGQVVRFVDPADFAPLYKFYNDVLGFEISDSYHRDDPGQTTFAFLHCGLGDRFTDHHTLAVGTPPGGVDAPRFDHVAFEVLDLDDLMTGNAHLRSAGWKHSWGVGRHVQGSQLFDYWRDPFGNKIEHWTDGDLVNDQHARTHGPLSPAGLSQWAPPVTPEFFE